MGHNNKGRQAGLSSSSIWVQAGLNNSGGYTHTGSPCIIHNTITTPNAHPMPTYPPAPAKSLSVGFRFLSNNNNNGHWGIGTQCLVGQYNNSGMGQLSSKNQYNKERPPPVSPQSWHTQWELGKVRHNNNTHNKMFLKVVHTIIMG